MTLEAFWSRVDKNGPVHPYRPELGNCWNWTGGKLVKGYGIIFHGRSKNGRRKRVLAHRHAYELQRGPIALGLLVCHSCDNRACVNAAHHFLGTYLDNNRDMMTKGRFATIGENHPGAILTVVKVKRICRLLKASQLTHEQIAARFGVRRELVSGIKQGRRWKQVTAGLL